MRRTCRTIGATRTVKMANNPGVKVTYYPTQFDDKWYVGFTLSIVPKDGQEFTVIPFPEFDTKAEANEAVRKAIEKHERRTA